MRCRLGLAELLNSVPIWMADRKSELGALDFGLIVDGAVIITENTLRRLAERRHELKRDLNRAERLSAVIGSAQEMIKPSVFGQAIIMLVYVPLLTFTGVEGNRNFSSRNTRSQTVIKPRAPVPSPEARSASRRSPSS